MLSRGVQPDAVNQIVNDYVRTGKLSLPSHQTRNIPDDPEIGPRTTRERIQYNRPKDLFTIDQSTGDFTRQRIPEDVQDYDVRTVATKRNAGMHIILDKRTGKKLSETPNGRGYNTFGYPDKETSAGGRGAGREAPDVALAKDTMRKYQAALLKGEDIPDEFMDSVRSASDLLGIDMAEVEEDPSLIDRIQNMASTATKGGVPEAKPKFGGSAVRFNPKGGKPLTKEKAQEFLQQAGGDKAKARALAKRAGYTF